MITRCLLCILFLTLCLNAEVKLYAPDTFIQNEPVVFELQAKGEEIEFPHIGKIEGFDVQKAGTSNQITIVNGKKSKTVNKKYLFYPTKTVRIPPFEVVIDDKTYKTYSKLIEVQHAKKTQNSNFDFKAVANKQTVYVGEPIVLDYIFKYKKDDKILELGLSNITFEHFWFKKIDDAKTKQEGEYTVQSLRYVLFAQKSGTLHLDAAKVVATMMDVNAQYSFFQRPTKRIDIYSNALEFDVKPLPQNVQLVGDFKLKESINKKQIKAGEALSYTISIQGEGNLEDMADIQLNIPNAAVYANDAISSFAFKNGAYVSKYTKTFSIVANDSFSIPALKIPYFSLNEKKVEYLTSPEHFIEIINPQKMQKSTLQKANPVEVQKGGKKSFESTPNEWLFFLYGVLSAFGVVLIGLIWRKKKRPKQKLSLLQTEVKKAKTNHALLKLLVPYLNKDEQLDVLIFELEKNENVDLKLKKKEIIKRLKWSL